MVQMVKRIIHLLPVAKFIASGKILGVLMKKICYFCLACIAILLVLACSAENINVQGEGARPISLSAPGPFGPFPETITLSSWGGQETDKIFPPGQDWEDNIWTRGVEQNLNIKFEWGWWAPVSEFIQKFNTSLASGEIPEFLSRIPYDVYLRLAEAGKLAPLDEALEQYGSEDLKNLMHLYDNQHYQKLSVNGKLYGIAPPENNNPVMVGYVRKDYLEAIDKEIPQNDYLTFTEDEFYQLVDQFLDNRDGYAIALSGELFGAGFNVLPLFAMGNAYPTVWVEQDGQLLYGSLTEESKQVLAKLRQINEAGAFPKEFFVSNPWDIGEALVRPNIGIVLGYYWFPAWAYNATKDSADIEWTPFLLKRNDGSYVITPMTLNPGTVLAMRADTQYPEAVVKIVNYSIENYYNNPDFNTLQDKDGSPIEPLFVPWGSTAAFSHLIEMQQIVDLLPEALQTGDPSILSTKYRGAYDKILEYQQSKKSTLLGDYGFNGPYGSFAYNAKLFRDPKLPIDKFQGVPSKKMSQNMGHLLSKRNEVFLKIITGEVGLEAFDNEWKTYWQNNGGSEVEAEVNDWYAKQQ